MGEQSVYSQSSPEWRRESTVGKDLWKGRF